MSNFGLGFSDDRRKTDTRCGCCGQWLRGKQTASGAWSLECGCGTRISGTTWTWIYAEFCKPYHGDGSTAPAHGDQTPRVYETAPPEV